MRFRGTRWSYSAACRSSSSSPLPALHLASSNVGGQLELAVHSIAQAAHRGLLLLLSPERPNGQGRMLGAAGAGLVSAPTTGKRVARRTCSLQGSSPRPHPQPGFHPQERFCALSCSFVAPSPCFSIVCACFAAHLAASPLLHPPPSLHVCDSHCPTFPSPVLDAHSTTLHRYRVRSSLLSQLIG